MATDITVSTVKVGASSGEKTYFSFDVVDLGSGQIKESFNTTDPNDAKAHYEKLKSQYPKSTVNGEKGKNPFEDGTFKAQTDYEVGGFKGAAEDKSVVGGVTDTSGTDQLYNEKDIRAFDTPGSSLYEKKHTKRAQATKTTKPARDISGVSPARRAEYEKLTEEQKAERGISGVFGDLRLQALVPRKKAACEDVRRGVDNNAFIVIGNDRVDKLHTGYGGKGHTQCDAIDIVAGLGGPSPNEMEEQSPSFEIDAARIYVSQKTDIDKNFQIGEFGNQESQGQESKTLDEKYIGKYGAKSGIALKADNIRVIGRESIRLVTGTDRKNSQNGASLAKSGIELVAMNDTTTLQPIVLGDNLQLALITILQNVEALAKIMHGYVKYQMKYNQAVAQHTHVSPFYALRDLPSAETVLGGIKVDIESAARTELSILKHITNIQGVKHNFLSESGESFINSRLNKVN